MRALSKYMDFVVSTCILHFIVQVKCKNNEALTITTQSDTHYTQLRALSKYMDFVVSTCILHFIVQVKCKNNEALTITTQSDTHYTQLQSLCKVGGGGTSTRCPPASYPPENSLAYLN